MSHYYSHSLPCSTNKRDYYEESNRKMVKNYLLNSNKSSRFSSVDYNVIKE